MSRISSRFDRRKLTKNRPAAPANQSDLNVAQMIRATATDWENILTSIRQKIVAIVDDDPGMRIATENLLLSFGYDTETFDSAEAFLNVTATSEATCLVVDVQLGDISGVELAQQLLADGLKYPIIFMTALDDGRMRSQAEAAGAVAYLNKPFPPDLLIDAIVKAIGEPMKQS
jgi:FixJ family two-component response regulator